MMEDKKLGKELARLARKNGICNEWYRKLRSTGDKKVMLQMYLDGIDFCISNDYPDNETIRRNFKGVMEEYGIFLDDLIDVVDMEKVVSLGRTSGTVSVDAYSVTELFLKHDSDIVLKARGHSFVEVDIFDNSRLSIFVEDEAKVHVNRYGGDVVIRSSPSLLQVKTTEKHQRTY